VMGISRPGRGNDLAHFGVGTTVCYVLADRTSHQDGLLNDQSNVGAQHLQGEIPQLIRIKGYPSRNRVVKARNQIGYSRLAGARRPDASHNLIWLCGKADIVQHGMAVPVGKADVLKLNRAMDTGRSLCPWPMLYFRLDVQYFQ